MPPTTHVISRTTLDYLWDLGVIGSMLRLLERRAKDGRRPVSKGLTHAFHRAEGGRTTKVLPDPESRRLLLVIVDLAWWYFEQVANAEL